MKCCQVFLPLFFTCCLVSADTFEIREGFTLVKTLDEFRAAIKKDNQNIRMKPGVYRAGIAYNPPFNLKIEPEAALARKKRFDNNKDLPDIGTIPRDLTTPPIEDTQPAPGKRVRMAAADYKGTEVRHSLYLPTDWKQEKKYPVIVEYAGNGPYRNKHGDTSTGKIEDCNLGYGISGGKGFIWICLPFISKDHQRNQRQWWGDVEATVEYCKTVVPRTCKEYGGDSSAVFLAGFSRGAVACNYIGLFDDEIAALWRGFICHSHYDGVRKWNYPGSGRDSAAARLERLNGRPQFISHEGSVEETRRYLQTALPKGNFTFQALPFRNHTDSWVLRDIPERKTIRKWLADILGEGV